MIEIFKKLQDKQAENYINDKELLIDELSLDDAIIAFYKEYSDKNKVISKYEKRFTIPKATLYQYVVKSLELNGYQQDQSRINEAINSIDQGLADTVVTFKNPNEAIIVTNDRELN